MFLKSKRQINAYGTVRKETRGERSPCLLFLKKNFCLDGRELARIDRDRIIDCLGEPDSVEKDEQGVIYDYFMPEKGIPRISFAFPDTLDTVGQIFIVFDLDDSIS
ncbi:MAG: hypothetical protein ACI3XJ_05280 [Oscillospiraceae bacterium]